MSLAGPAALNATLPGGAPRAITGDGDDRAGHRLQHRIQAVRKRTRAVEMFRGYNDDTIEKLVHDNGIDCDHKRLGKSARVLHDFSRTPRCSR